MLPVSLEVARGGTAAETGLLDENDLPNGVGIPVCAPLDAPVMPCGSSPFGGGGGGGYDLSTAHGKSTGRGSSGTFCDREGTDEGTDEGTTPV